MIGPRRTCIVSCLLLTASILVQQTVGQEDGRRPLTHDDYDAWTSMDGLTISRDGRWIAYAIRPQVGDPELVVREVDGEVEHRHPRGRGPKFTADGRFVAFEIPPGHADKRAYDYAKLTEKGKKGKKKGRRGRGRRGGSEEEQARAASGEKNDEKDGDDDEPKKALGILDVTTGEVRVIERLRSFDVPEEGPAFVVYSVEAEKKKKKKEEEEADDTEEEEESTEPEEPEAEKGAEEEQDDEEEAPRDYLKDGHPLIIEDLASGESERIEGVAMYRVLDKNGFVLVERSSKKDDDDIDRGLFARHLESPEWITLVDGGAEFKQLTTDRDETRLAFVSTRRDRDAEKPTYDLHAWDFQADEAAPIVSHVETAGFPVDACVSSSQSLTFCRDGGALLFGVARLPDEDLPDLLDDDKVTLDIWHYQDPQLQPMQRVRAERERNEGWTAAWHFDGARMVMLEEDPDESTTFLTDDGSRALVSHDRPYDQFVSWDRGYRDVFVVNTVDGSRRLVLERQPRRPSASPSGRHLLFVEDGDWRALDLVDGGRRNLTKGLTVSFLREDWDTPSEPRAYGVAGFTEDERHVLIYDRFDIWKIALDGSGRDNLTDGYGRAGSTRLRWENLDDDRRHLPVDGEILLSAFDEETMASGYYVDRVDGLGKPERLVMLDRSLGRLRKAEESDRRFFTLSTFREFPDLWCADATDFSDRRRLTALNPQQHEVRWGDAELVRWHSMDGTPLKGILIKPDGFDPSRQYPMMVYFYEKSSQGLHRHRTPSPGTSPNPTYYVSNGYLFFIPDIVYDVGYPGESCFKCVVPGVMRLVREGFVDPERIGAAGHSWGGYQTAYLITRTDIFTAVESGAPVSNMTSAYGGIRWSSGMSRAFQYEKTQSRIGGSLWQYPMRYLENSPLFAADRVDTPILMLHNDEDGAVPWYQGIEYFTALRRLGKECYLFNYNKAGHGLRRRAEQMDWTIRMQQYFDHHLRDAPMPPWMERGVPFIDREREKLEFRPPRVPTDEG